MIYRPVNRLAAPRFCRSDYGVPYARYVQRHILKSSARQAVSNMSISLWNPSAFPALDDNSVDHGDWLIRDAAALFARTAVRVGSSFSPPARGFVGGPVGLDRADERPPVLASRALVVP